MSLYIRKRSSIGSRKVSVLVTVILCLMVAAAVLGIWLVKDRDSTFKILRPTMLSMVEGTRPKTASEYVDRAQAYLKWRETDKALIDVNTALTLNRYDASAYAVRGSIYFMKEDYPRAIANYKTAISLNSDDPICFFENGESLYVLGRYLKALDSYNVAVSMKNIIKPKHRNKFLQHALWGRGKTYAMLGNVELAGRDFKKVELLEKGGDPDQLTADESDEEDPKPTEIAKLPEDPILVALQKEELAKFQTAKRPPVLIFTTRDIKPGEKIPDAALEEGIFVDTDIPEGAILSRKSIIGRTAVRPIPAGSRLKVTDIKIASTGVK